ncbi:MAG: cysteine--tRNA ligase [Actinomycetota bacterium]
MAVRVYNTLTRRKDDLVPREAGKIAMYVCGPTVYNHIHVGNARASIVFDVIRRYLAWRGYEVRFVQNYTDIDDRIIAKAEEEKRSTEEVANDYSAAFEQVMSALDVSPPDTLVKATEHIPQMIDMISGLVSKGYAYEAGGSVWFSVEKFPGYGSLSGRNFDALRAGERVEPDPSKQHVLDFALWKGAKPGEPSWESPWGPGRPGWHIECSAMSLEHLGMGFDIHGGGADLIFPHHENEIAQSEAFDGSSPFVRYWLHNGLVRIDEEKMSKSLRNFVLLKDFLTAVPAPAARLLNVMSHYRSDVDFGDEQLAIARNSYERLRTFFANAKEITASSEPAGEAADLLDRFREAMDDDFNTPQAMVALHDITRRGNTEMQEAMDGSAEARSRLAAFMGAFQQIAGILGVEPRLEERLEEADDIEKLVADRERARKGGDYARADEIREILRSRGVAVEDTPAGPRWRKI